MPVTQQRSVDFGTGLSNATGSSGVGFTIYNPNGTINTARTTVGVVQLITGSGLYGAPITFPDVFQGHVVWDTGNAFTSSLGTFYATEQFNVEENDPKVANTWTMVNAVTGTIQSIFDATLGRWRLLNNQLILYKTDNATVVATFNLFDSTGTPTMNSVFDRQHT